MNSTINPDDNRTGVGLDQAQAAVASTPRVFHSWVYLVAVLIVLATAVSGIYIKAWYAPLMVGGAVFGMVLAIFWLRKPIWALLPAIIMIFLPLGLIPAELQSLGNRGLTLATLGCWGANLVFQRRLLRWTFPTLLFTMFVTWSLLSLLWAGNMAEGVQELQVYALRLILFLILIPNLINTQDDLKKFLGVVAITGWILLFASMYVVLTEGYVPGSRLQVFDSNANGLGVQAVVSSVGMLWWAMQPGRNRTTRMVLGAIYLVLTMGLTALSGSRGSSITLGLMLLVFWLQKPSRFWANLGIFLVVLALPTIPVLFTTTIERFMVTSDDTALGGREVLWEASLRLIADQPILGVGIGNASEAVRPYLEVLKSIAGNEGVSLHNPLLTIWVETGLIGLLLYLGVLASAVFQFYKMYRQKGSDPVMQNYFALVTAVFCGYMASWFKGGGMEKEFTYYFMLALLIIPSVLPLTRPVLAGTTEQPTEVA